MIRAETNDRDAVDERLERPQTTAPPAHRPFFVHATSWHRPPTLARGRMRRPGRRSRMPDRSSVAVSATSGGSVASLSVQGPPLHATPSRQRQRSIMSVCLLLLVCLCFCAVVAVPWTVHGTGLSSHFDHWSVGQRRARAATWQAGGSHCKATCSNQVMLPCDFPSLDNCLLATCRDLCQKDKRKVNSCYCQTVGEVTMRACFCQPDKSQLAKPKLLRF